MSRRILTAREQVAMLAPWRVAVIEDSRGPVMYHATGPQYRDSIQTRGLQTSLSEDDPESIPGIYMSPKPSPHTSQDIWAIDTSKLRHLEPDDPGQMHEFQDVGGSYWTQHDVPPEAMTLHYQAEDRYKNPQWWSNPEDLAYFRSNPTRTTGRTAAMQPVTLYTKPGCPACVGTKRYLDKHEIPHQIVDVTTDPEAYRHVTENLGYSSVPVVDAGNGNHWTGLRPDRIQGLLG